MNRIRVLALTSLLFSLTACKSWYKADDEDNNVYKGMTAAQLYKEAEDALAKKEYTSAAKRLEALESMYPFSNYAERAQMNLMHAYYQKGDYPSSAATAQRFIHLYPRAKHVDYAYYMKAMADYKQSRGMLTDKFPLDESWRDPGTMQEAYSDFGTLVQRFPESRYKANALQRMIYLRNMFAQRELNIGKYYYERKKYVAAAGRASYLLKNYPQAPSVREALILLYHSNKELKLKSAANDALRVYQANYHANPGPVFINGV